MPAYAYAKIIFNSRKAATVKVLLQQYTKDYNGGYIPYALISNLNTELSRSATVDGSSLLYANISTLMNGQSDAQSDKDKPGAPFAY